MGIFQRKENKATIWYVDYWQGSGPQRQRIRKAIGKKTDAIAYLGKVQGAKKEGKLFDMKREKPNYTFDQLQGKYIEAYKGQKSFYTKKTYFPVLMKYFGGRVLTDINTYDLIEFRNQRKATPIISQNSFSPPKVRSEASVNRTLSALRHMLSCAVEWGLLEESPFKKCNNLFYKENNKRLRFLTVDEANRLLDCCADHLRPIVVVALNTGMRRGEILSLRWVQIKNGFIYLRETKTGEPRQIPINKTLKALFQSLPRHLKSEHVFFNKHGKPYKDVKKSFNSAVKRAGLDDFHFHDTRHSFASNLVMKGVSLKAVAELLGHKNIKMTMRYSHLSEEYVKSAVELLDEE